MDHFPQGSARILIADQDKTLTQQLRSLFVEHGYSVDSCFTGGVEFIQKMDQGVDLLLLDCAFPFSVGSSSAGSREAEQGAWDSLAELRRRQTTPVILMSRERSACINAFRLVDAGDFIAKPFSPLEALVRSEALLRRQPMAGIRCGCLTVGPLSLSRTDRSVYFAQKPILLTAIQFKLLWYLAEHHDQVLSKSCLHQWVLDKSYCRDDRSIDMHLSRIRKKLLAAGMAADALQTIRGRGYRLTLSETMMLMKSKNLTSFLTSKAVVDVATPSRTLQRLCKHFSHKVEAKWKEEEGFVDFQTGQCTLQAGEQRLRITCTAANEKELREIEQTLERHLPVMAGLSAETLACSWDR